MASSSNSKADADVDDEVPEEALEHFDDFTLASSWERFISEIEAVCRLWMADGPKNLLEKGAVLLVCSSNLYKVKSEMKYALKSYCMEYYFESTSDGKAIEWNSNLHDLQLCFGVKEFLVIAPQSASGVVLDAPEASKLLSAVAIALSNCSSLWPAFVPVHDPSRKAYIGIQNMGTVFTRRFEADKIGSQAYSTSDLSLHLFKVQFAMRLTYRTVPYDDDDDIKGIDAELTNSRENPSGETSNRTQWDDDCSWSEWYSAEDPVRGFELIAILSDKMVESSMEMAELENASPHEAEKWLISPSFSPNLLEGSKGSRIGFSSQLHLLVDALEMSFEAQFMEDFVSVENPGSDNLNSSMVIPPPTVIDRVMKELFHEGEQLTEFSDGEHKTSRYIKGAPLESLFAQFCLHSLWFGNCHIREYVREVRWCWEESQSLPRMPANGLLDLSTCLINQKLHMLAICIEKKRQLNEDFQDCIGSEDHTDYSTEEESVAGDETSNKQKPIENFSGKVDSFSISDDSHSSGRIIARDGRKPEDASLPTDKKPSECTRRGSAGSIDSMMLLKSYQSMHAPYTQEAPLMTEDMHEERLQAVEAFGDSFDFSAQLEKDILTSDMSAFKAANPDAVFEDFIRWHSPGDWEEDDLKDSVSSSGINTGKPKDNWPPQGHLSKRMSEQGNLWRKIWDSVPALPASEQKPLLDPNREGEKVLHYLETLRPHQLLEQMVCTAFRAAADTLNQTSYGEMEQMVTKMDQLYLTMASGLKPLQDSETIADLRRLSVVFEHVEKLLTLAASLHRKLLRAPRLSKEIFSDFYSFYIPRMGTGLKEDVVNKEFDKKLEVRNHERGVVSSMFSPPTANQSWRKVLSMGNLLNGHEPILREIIFSLCDKVNGNHYAARDPNASQTEMQTYRMYICGTSNDLRVALSVVSCD
ncbi:rab3 GTPase-activating protein catalytic subunit isoform X1 [Senna tora]|uniref:Rab3 GTPase-activating protein catalytic subunit n=1 Tax=Senna tora TaxID=362788 RepID=A0A834TNM9_9FABA|nr:rab3 GTPase-activating protein catalytic subunit isoform X1 [Senna tora]